MGSASIKPSIYEQVVEVTSDYLGPAADRFISRQIMNHLRKRPEQLREADLPVLIDWLKLSMAFLTSDAQLIGRYIAELQAIAPGSAASKERKRHGRTTSRI